MEDKNYEKDFLKDTHFLIKLQEGNLEFPDAIYICKLNSKNQKINTSRDCLDKLLNRTRGTISKKYPYLLDDKGEFKISKINIGFQLQVKKGDYNSLLQLLNKEKKVTLENDKISFFIDMSLKNPQLDKYLIKTQFKNIPPNINEESGKLMFSTFGTIHNLDYKQGIWNVIYSDIKWFLPYSYHQHLNKYPKNRWFHVAEAECSFSSKQTCQKCNIKGHHKSCCPGEELIQKINKKSPPKQEGSAKLTQNEIINSSSESAISSLVEDEDESYESESPKPKTKKKVSDKKPVINNTKKKK